MKQITFTYKDVDYTLEFSRNTVKALDRLGFDPEKVSSQPMTMIPLLWQGAFAMHHKNVKPEIVNEIYSHITDRTDLVGKLLECYYEPITAMLDEPEKDEGNLNWGANF